MEGNLSKVVPIHPLGVPLLAKFGCDLGMLEVTPAPNIEKPRVTPAPSIETPRVTPAPSIEKPRVTPAPTINRPRVSVPLYAEIGE